MSTVAAKLDEARALIEKGWTQGAHARDASGKWVTLDDPAAVCWCALGAIFIVMPRGESWDVYHAFRRVLPMDSHIDGWNDANGRTQAEVIDAFKLAAKLAREQVSA